MGTGTQRSVVQAAAVVAGITVTVAVVRLNRRKQQAKAFVDRLVSRGEGQVHIAHPGTTAQKIAALCSGGKDSLAITADWDRTLTGGKSVSSHGVLETCPALGESFRKESSANTAKYLPMEQDPNLTMQEKLPHMQTWYRLNHKAIIKCGVARSMLETAVSMSLSSKKLFLRDGALDFIGAANDAGVPLLIFSAGLADVIEEVLVQRAAPAIVAPGSSVSVVSNRMIWSATKGASDAQLVDFSEPLIHMFNKKMQAVPPSMQPHKPVGWTSSGDGSSSGGDRSSSSGSGSGSGSSSSNGGGGGSNSRQRPRRHALLLGDGLGDAGMVDGALAAPDTVLRVGFLNYQDYEKHLAKYEKAFDIVLIGPAGDQDMRVPQEILDLVVSG